MSLSGNSGSGDTYVTITNAQVTMGVGSSITAGSLIANTMTMTSGSITDTTGAISFDDEVLTTTGGFNGNVLSADGTICLDNGATNTAATFSGTTSTANQANQLTTARLIATVPFDGTADIDLEAINLTDIASVGSGSIITSAERTKLAGIEAGANITNSVNGAVMKTGNQTILGIKSFSDDIVVNDDLLKQSDATYFEYTSQEFPLYAGINVSCEVWISFHDGSESPSPRYSTSLLLAHDTYVRQLVFSCSSNFVGTVFNLVYWVYNIAITNTNYTVLGTVTATGSAHRMYTLDVSTSSQLRAGYRIGVSVTQGSTTNTDYQMSVLCREKKDVY